MNPKGSGRARDPEEGGETEIEHRQSWREWVLNSPVIRLQVSITLILTVTATLMTVVIWKQTSDTLYRQVDSHSLMVRKNLLMRVYERLHTHIGIAAEDNELVARRFHVHKFADKDEKNLRFNHEVRMLLWPRFRLKPQYLSFFFTRDVDGATVGYNRQDKQLVFFSTMGAGNYTMDTYTVHNETGDSISAYPSLGTLDFREGLQDVMQYPNLNTSLKLMQWASYVFLYMSTRVTEETLVDASTNLTSTRGINGALQGTYALEELSHYMSKFDFLGGGMFAMTEDGQLIAVSDKTLPYKINPETNEKILIRASEMNNSVLAGAARWLESKHSKEFPVYASNVKIGGSRYFVDSSTVNLTLMSMCLVVVTPRESIMGVVDRSSRRIAIFMSCVVIACLAVSVGLLLLLTKHMGNELRLKKELSQQLEAKERAEACTASARLFLANLSHDLRTPMAAIIGLLEIMSGNGLDMEQKALMEQVQSNAETLHTLLNTVLDISKVEAGTLELQCAPFDLQHELETIADLFALEGMKKGVEVVLDLPEDLPKVIGDCIHVRQIFANLLSNSMRFTPSGYVLIRGFVLDQENETEGYGQRSCDTSFSTSVESGGKWASGRQGRLASILSFKRKHNRETGVAWKNSVRYPQPFARHHPRFTTPSVNSSTSALSPSHTSRASHGVSATTNHTPSVVSNPVTLLFEVEDSGHGIGVEHREAMFQNFVSVPNTSTRYGGTGVGLGIVRSLVQLMGGNIRIIDKVTPGTLFRFDIRLERQQQEEAIEGLLPRAEGVRGAPDLVPLLGCSEAGAWPQHVFPISHWDTLKWSSVENVVSTTSLHMCRKVLLVMPHRNMQSKVAATWFERRGCHVTMESSWESIGAAMGAISHRYLEQTETINESDVAQGNVHESNKKANKGGGFRCLVLIDSALIPNEQEECLALRRLQSLRADMETIEKRLSLSTGDLHCCTPPRVSTALLITAATRPALQREARANGCTLLQKPLIPSRLTPLLTFFDATSDLADRDRTIPLTSSPVISEIVPVHSPHETHAAEHSHKDSDCAVDILSAEDDAECSNEDENRRALRKPSDVSTSSMLVQRTPINGSVAGQREQKEYHTAATQFDQLVQKPLPPFGMPPLVNLSNGVGDLTARDMSTFSQINGEHAQQAHYAPDLRRDSCHSPETSSKVAVVNGRVQSGEEYARALREPEMLTAPMLVQGTESIGRLTGQRQQLPQILTDVDVARGSVRGGTESVAIDVEIGRSEWEDTLTLRRESQEVFVSENMRWDTKENVKRDTGMVMVGADRRSSDARERSLCEDKKGVPQTPHLNEVEDFKGLRILLVEDTPVMAQIATRQMEKIGAKVRWAQDGQVAVEMFTEIYGGRGQGTDAGQSPKSVPVTPRSLDDGFDVIVMDCQMPRLDGYGATAAIRELEKVLGIHTPIIALTAHAMTTDRKKCLDAGMDEYLTKPLNLALFKATLAELLKSKHS